MIIDEIKWWKIPAAEGAAAVGTCVHCKKEKHEYTRVEKHHWAPRSLFDDYDDWPTALLCPKCHQLWHATVFRDYGVPPTNRSLERVFVHKDDGERESANNVVMPNSLMRRFTGKSLIVGEVGIIMLVDPTGKRREFRGTPMNKKKFHFKGGAGYKKRGNKLYVLKITDACVFRDPVCRYVIVDKELTFKRNQEMIQ